MVSNCLTLIAIRVLLSPRSQEAGHNSPLGSNLFGGIDMRSKSILLAASAFALFAVSPANAALTLYQGTDQSPAQGGPWTNSDAAAAAFDAAAATTTKVTFESQSVGSFSSLSPAAGLTITGVDYNGANQSIANAPLCTYSLCGGNITSGGANFLSLYGGQATFSFSSAVRAFGMYVGGQQISSINVAFNNGTDQTIFLDPNSYIGQLGFIGFTDTSNLIASVRLNAENDILAVDDVRFAVGRGGGVPEPAAWALMLSGFGLVGSAMRRRRALEVTYA